MSSRSKVIVHNMTTDFCLYTVGEAVLGEGRVWKAPEDPKATSPVMSGNYTLNLFFKIFEKVLWALFWTHVTKLAVRHLVHTRQQNTRPLLFYRGLALRPKNAQFFTFR